MPPEAALQLGGGLPDRESLEIAESRMPEDGDVEWDRHGRDPTVVEGYSWSALRLGIDASRLVDSAVLARSSIPVKSTVPLDVALHVITLAPARRVPVDLSWLRRVFVGRALDWSPGTVLPRHVVSDRFYVLDTAIRPDGDRWSRGQSVGGA